MFDKLEDLVKRLDEVMQELSEPDVVSDQNRFRNLMKEQNELAPIVEKYKEYKEAKQTIEDSVEMLEEEHDEEMRELLKEELSEAKKNVEQYEEELKVLLLPKDPNDDKNVIVEIRAGAGGDEAALFAAEIYRMYKNYAESKRWKTEFIDVNENGIGGFKEVSFMINGQGAYSRLKYESAAWDTPETTVQLLDALEEAFRVAGKTASAVTFFNPMHLPWVIPGSPGHEHNNMPGIATDLPLHERMLAHGYTETTQETAMYRTLTDYAIPPEIRALEHRTAAEGCTLALYDPNRHHGLDAMLQALDNPDWTVRVTAAARDGLCLPVALAGNTVAGFAGPVYPEPTGRGYFAGIGIAPQYQHRHLGKLLFFRLCAEEKRAGAVYMSLFTGVANPARRIYESAGFTSVRTFGVLLKTL